MIDGTLSAPSEIPMASRPTRSSSLPPPPSGSALSSFSSSVGAKLAVATVGILALVSVLLYVQLTGRERVSLVESKHKAASMVADLFAAGLAAPLDFDD